MHTVCKYAMHYAAIRMKYVLSFLYRDGIHVSTISFRFLGIILRVLRLEVSVYKVYITNQFQTTFDQSEGGVKSISRGDCE